MIVVSFVVFWLLIIVIPFGWAGHCLWKSMTSDLGNRRWTIILLTTVVIGWPVWFSVAIAILKNMEVIQ